MQNKRIRGFTLSELMLAAAILAFVLTGLLALYINCINLNQASRSSILALSHAQYILEEIRGTTFSQVEAKINNGDWDLDSDEIQSAPYNLAALNSEAINTAVTQSGNPLGVSVTVTWMERGQRQMTKGLRTLLTSY